MGKGSLATSTTVTIPAEENLNPQDGLIDDTDRDP